MGDGVSNQVEHGGSLMRANILFPHAQKPFVDLSTGISPHPYPFFDLPASALTRLPEPAQMAQLLELAASYYGAPSAAHIVAGPGTQIMLPLVYGLLQPGRAAVLGPTYQEHALAARVAGHAVTEVTKFEALRDFDLAIVVNPNNPDGRVIGRDDLLALAAHMRAKGALLVVDEAFMDVGPREQSVSGDVGAGGLVALRSFGKFFGLAGLRLGFVLGDERVVQRLADVLGPWAVAGPALEYGVAALADVEWQANTRTRLAGDAVRLDSIFESAGLKTRGTTLFRHISTPEAPAIFEHLGRQGIFVRRFSDRSAELRFGLPGPEEEWRRLEQALAAY